MAQCPAGYAPRLFWPSSHFYGFMGNERNLWRSLCRERESCWATATDRRQLFPLAAPGTMVTPFFVSAPGSTWWIPLEVAPVQKIGVTAKGYFTSNRAYPRQASSSIFNCLPNWLDFMNSRVDATCTREPVEPETTFVQWNEESGKGQRSVAVSTVGQGGRGQRSVAVSTVLGEIASDDIFIRTLKCYSRQETFIINISKTTKMLSLHRSQIDAKFKATIDRNLIQYFLRHENFKRSMMPRKAFPHLRVAPRQPTIFYVARFNRKGNDWPIQMTFAIYSHSKQINKSKTNRKVDSTMSNVTSPKILVISMILDLTPLYASIPLAKQYPFAEHAVTKSVLPHSGVQ
ncbi:hypothetical protein EAG_01256 [Camponotus floridanus]|uniref:Uncharacterized protein n=1 Tax=Camponotus floridanus TaxID=104421 RepID=E2ALB8_CAMFO|nr:hypothetical protein EAG_01256 [Camponotus floridanus]